MRDCSMRWKTKYLSELNSGDEVAILASSGNQEKATIGRLKDRDQTSTNDPIRDSRLRGPDCGAASRDCEIGFS